MKASFLLCRITMPITCERRANTNTRDYSGDFWTFSSRKSTKSHVCLFFCFFFIPSSFFLKKKTKNKTAECAGCLISHTDTNVFFKKFEPKKKEKTSMWWACRAGGWRRSSRQVSRSSWRRMAGRRRSRSGRRRCATARASAPRAGTSSRCSAASASASPSASGVTWVWPSSAWSITTPSTRTARSSSKRCPQTPPRYTPPHIEPPHVRFDCVMQPIRGLVKHILENKAD